MLLLTHLAAALSLFAAFAVGIERVHSGGSVSSVSSKSSSSSSSSKPKSGGSTTLCVCDILSAKPQV